MIGNAAGSRSLKPLGLLLFAIGIEFLAWVRVGTAVTVIAALAGLALVMGAALAARTADQRIQRKDSSRWRMSAATTLNVVGVGIVPGRLHMDSKEICWRPSRARSTTVEGISISVPSVQSVEITPASFLRLTARFDVRVEGTCFHFVVTQTPSHLLTAWNEVVRSPG